jgi:hypothetical protein
MRVGVLPWLVLLALDLPVRAALSNRPAHPSALAKTSWQRASLGITAAGFAAYLSILPVQAAGSAFSANNALAGAGSTSTVTVTVAKADATPGDNPNPLLNGIVSGGVIKVTKELVLHPIETVK